MLVTSRPITQSSFRPGLRSSPTRAAEPRPADSTVLTEEQRFAAQLKDLSRQGARFELYGRSGFVYPMGKGVQAAERFLAGRRSGPQFLKFTPARGREPVEVKDPERFKLFLTYYEKGEDFKASVSQVYDRAVRRRMKPEQARALAGGLAEALARRSDWPDHDYSQGEKLKEVSQRVDRRLLDSPRNFDERLEVLCELVSSPNLAPVDGPRLLNEAVSAKAPLGLLKSLAGQEGEQLSGLAGLISEDESLFKASLYAEPGTLPEILHQGRSRVMLEELEPESAARPGLAHYAAESPETAERLYQARREDPKMYQEALTWFELNHPSPLKFEDAWQKILEQSLYGPNGPSDAELEFEDDYIIIGDVPLPTRTLIL